MRQPRFFLVVAEDPNRIFLISTTLHRKFPNAVVHTCTDAGPAMDLARSQTLDAIVAHRSRDMDELPLLAQLRSVSIAPIVALAHHDLEKSALGAGASRFLRADQWLLIGAVVGELVEATPRS